MYNAYIVYCIDGHNDISVKVDSLKEQLQKIKEEATGIFSSPFSVDVVIEGIGRISIALAEDTVLCYKSSDLEIQLTALGDMLAEGSTSFYFGDYSLMSNKYLIPYELAFEVLNNWISTGTLSDKVMWTDKLYVGDE